MCVGEYEMLQEDDKTRIGLSLELATPRLLHEQVHGLWQVHGHARLIVNVLKIKDLTSND